MNNVSVKLRALAGMIDKHREIGCTMTPEATRTLAAALEECAAASVENEDFLIASDLLDRRVDPAGGSGTVAIPHRGVIGRRGGW